MGMARMRLAVISDIHGNLEALEAVLADIESQGADQIVCLGDCVGYGPEPENVINEIRRRNIATVIGNHEMALRDPEQLSWFNPLARLSLEKTLTLLSPASITYLEELPFSQVVAGSRLVHGYPPESPRTYLFQKTLYELKKDFQVMPERICFVGHTHDLEIVTFDGTGVTRRALGQDVVTLNRSNHYIISVGSVGQPRDGNNNAKYVLWNQTADALEVRYIPYDIARTVAKIRDAGLPEQHAARLF
jgi:predicted phosphodiesterase